MHLTEIISNKDPRAFSKEVTAAKRQEIKNLLDKGTFEITLDGEVPPKANALPGRFVLTLKSIKDGKIKYKARYVFGGHKDKFKHMIVHPTSTLQPSSIRLLLALATTYEFCIWVCDVRQAYLSSAEIVTREVYIKNLVPEFELDSSQSLQLLKPLHGPFESGELWHKTLDCHHVEDLGMKPLRSDHALYIFMNDKVLKALSEGYLDDLIRAGDRTFKTICSKTGLKFDLAKDQYLPCIFTGFFLGKTSDKATLHDQN